MSLITKPMLASNETIDIYKISYPCYVTPKLDGIRALTINSQLLSRSFKPIKNKNIKETLKDLPDGLDGELVSGNFQETTHRVMKEEETEGDWGYYIFDYVKDSLSKPYLERIQDLWDLVESQKYSLKNVNIVAPIEVNTSEELLLRESEFIEEGYEGLIIRSGSSPYKCGRSTLKEGYLLKLKRFLDTEGVVIDFVEYENNNNEAEKDNFGRTKRSSAKAGKSGADMLGKFILRMNDGRVVGCGSGFNMEQRKEIWANKSSYLNKIVKFKYFPFGEKDLPRHPIFLGFRDPDDMS